MRILIWHGYSSAAPASNIYTRQLARELSREGHDVTVLFPGAATRAVRPRWRGDDEAVRRRAAAGVRADRYEGYEVERVQDCSRAELDAWVEANAAAVREELPPSSSSSTTSCSAARSASRPARRTSSRRTARSFEYAMRGNEELSAWGGEVLEGAVATIVGSGHIRSVVREVCGTVDRVHEIPPGVDIELWQPAPRARRSSGSSRRRGSIRRTPATPTSGCRTRGTPCVSPSSSSATGRRSSTTAS